MVFLTAALSTVFLGSMSAAESSDIVLTGSGTAVIDGVFSPGEWTHAASATFDADVPEGGTTPVTLYEMDDGVNLYLAFAIPRSSFGGATNPIISFDNDDDGQFGEEGDDGLGMFVGVFSPATFFDIVWAGRAPACRRSCVDCRIARSGERLMAKRQRPATVRRRSSKSSTR
jgi:hypothetical protein